MRMNVARIVVLTIALRAGDVAASFASGTSIRPPAAVQPVAQLQTIDVLVAKSGIGLGQTLASNDIVWRNWPASIKLRSAPMNGLGATRSTLSATAPQANPSP
ncbi:MAG TPA: hypothetical protein VKT76_03025 [Bradyrhizobium sp.]|nr:hypothetical protein [Bradyrhizobium sp.]